MESSTSAKFSGALKSVAEPTTSDVSVAPVAGVDYDDDPAKNVYVKGFGPMMTDDLLRVYFARFGSIQSCVVMKDDRGVSRNFGFVSFKTEKQARNAIRLMNEAHIAPGMKLVVAQFQRKEDRVATLKENIGSQKVNVLVRHLAKGTSEKMLEEFFAKFGEVVEVKITRTFGGAGEWHGRVAFSTYAAAKAAVRKSLGTQLFGKTIFATLQESTKKRGVHVWPSPFFPGSIQHEMPASFPFPPPTVTPLVQDVAAELSTLSLQPANGA